MLVFLCLGRARKIANMSVRPSARPHGTTILPIYVFLLNFIFEYFSKICRENSSFVKIRQA